MSPSPGQAVPAFGTPAYYRNPYPAYRAWLDAGQRTVRLSPHLVGVTHHRDCLDILRDSRLSAKRHVGKFAHYTAEERGQLTVLEGANASQMFFMDPPGHPRIRKPLMRAFSPDAGAAMQPRLRALFDGILDRVPRGVEIDFMRSVAHPFPALVIGEILGVPEDGWERLMEWSDAFIEFIATFQAPLELGLRANRSTADMLKYLDMLIETKRAEPGDDLLGQMIQSLDSGELTREELLAQAVLLLVAGHETTRNLIGNGLLTLLRHPAEMERLREDRTLIRSAVEEFLRFEGPIQGTSRLVVEDFEFHGEKVLAGQSLLTMLGCANRDQRQFPEPDRFDPARKNNSHLDFGAGAHACLGIHLARMEAQIAFAELLDRYDSIELCEEEPEWNLALTLRGLKRLNVILR